MVLPEEPHGYRKAPAVGCTQIMSLPVQWYLVGAVQGADEKGDLLHHRQVLLQVLQLLEEPRWPQVDFILGEETKKSGTMEKFSIPLHRSQPKGWVLTVRCLPGRRVFLGPGVVDDDVVLVVGAALLPHLHDLDLREGRAPLHHVFGTQGHQAADFQLASAEGGCKKIKTKEKSINTHQQVLRFALQALGKSVLQPHAMHRCTPKRGARNHRRPCAAPTLGSPAWKRGKIINKAVL